YRVTTFDEVRRRMEEAKKKAEEDARKAEGKETQTARAPPENNVEVDVNVKNTGEKKTINGVDTRESERTVAVRQRVKRSGQGRVGHARRHVAGGAGRGVEAAPRVGAARRAEAGPRGGGRGVGRTDGGGDGAVSDDEAGHGAHDRRRAEAGRHPDRDDDPHG